MTRIGFEPKFKNERKKRMKIKIMKIVPSLLLVITAIAALGHLSAYSQKSAGEVVVESGSLAAELTGKGSRALEGTWNVIVTIRNCQTGTPVAAFKAMDLFIQGGSLVDTNAAPPSTRGPGFGSWEFVAEHEFSSVLRFFLYNADGSFAGVRRIAQNISLGEDNAAWTSDVSITVFDPAGNQVATACGTAAGTRAE
jgi:hypothetical protein